MNLCAILTLAVTAALVCFVALGQRHYFVTQYLFFIRYPILCGAILLILPWAGPRIAPALLNGLYTLEPLGAGFAAFFNFLACLTVIYVGRLIWVSTPFRCGLPWKRVADPQELENTERRSSISSTEQTAPIQQPRSERPTHSFLLERVWVQWGFLASCSLGTKLVIGGEGPWSLRGLAVLSGSLLGVVFHHFAVGMGQQRKLAEKLARRWEQVFSTVAQWTEERERERLLGLSGNSVGDPLSRFQRLWRLLWIACLGAIASLPRDIRRHHERAAGFCVLSMGAYIVFCLVTSPYLDWKTTDQPALNYLLCIIILLTWLLGLLSYQFDVSRLPGVSLAVGFLLLVQIVRPGGHEFPVLEQEDHELTSTQALIARQNIAAAGPHAQRPMVVVAASGGGITAELWTAKVLTELGKHLSGFHERVALLSTVSGGGVGAMLYVDSFREHGPAPELLQTLVERSSQSSLAAIAWGMAYLDMARLILGSILREFDRGWAHEQSLRKSMSVPDATLSHWRIGVGAGWRPLQVFNVSLQESGGRVLLAPVKIPSSHPVPLFGDMESYLGSTSDLAVSTAARLSAAFPYVAPQARPSRTDGGKHPRYHAGDGGYIDNSGVLSAIEVVKAYLAEAKNSNSPHPVPKEIVLIVIRAAPPVGVGAQAEPARGNLLTTWDGPLKTLLNVRVTSQVARTLGEIEHAEHDLEREFGITLFAYDFCLSGNPPLSWHLTSREKREILAHWPEDELKLPLLPSELNEVRLLNRNKLNELKEVWN